MRRLKLLTTLVTPEGRVPPGSEIEVGDAEAKTLLGAIGLAEDLGPVKRAPKSAEKTAEKTV